MRQVGIPVGVVGMKQRAVKLFAVLAANGWPSGLTVNQIAALSGMSWLTVDAALDELRGAGFIDQDNQPVGGAA